MLLHFNCQRRVDILDNLNCVILILHGEEIYFCPGLDAGHLAVQQEQRRLEGNHAGSSDVDRIGRVLMQLGEFKHCHARFNGYYVGEVLGWNRIVVGIESI